MLVLDKVLTLMLSVYSYYRILTDGNSTGQPTPADFYTYNNVTKDFVPISEDNLKALSNKGKICFIIHGYCQDISMSGYPDLASAFEMSQNCTVIGVSWERLAYSLFYFPSAYGAKTVGQYVSSTICKLGLKPEAVHIAGHSLGAHAAGHAGRHYKLTCGKGAINMITGLDPAHQAFVDSPEALHPKDGKTVAVVHTDAFFGLWQPCGTHDFFANNGVQSGCPLAALKKVPTMKDKTLPLILGEIVFCSHQLSVDYLIESMSGGKKKFVGRGTAGACQLRGGELNCTSGSYHFVTGSSSPYALE